MVAEQEVWGVFAFKCCETYFEIAYYYVYGAYVYIERTVFLYCPAS